MRKYYGYIPVFINKTATPAFTVQDFPTIATEVQNRLNKSSPNSTNFDVIYSSPVAALIAVLSSHDWYKSSSSSNDFYIAEILFETPYSIQIQYSDTLRCYFNIRPKVGFSHPPDAVSVFDLLGPCSKISELGKLTYIDGVTLPSVQYGEAGNSTDSLSAVSAVKPLREADDNINTISVPEALFKLILSQPTIETKKSMLKRVFENKQFTLLELCYLYDHFLQNTIGSPLLDPNDWKAVINTLLEHVIKSFETQYLNDQNHALHYLRNFLASIATTSLFTTFPTQSISINIPELNVFSQLTDREHQQQFLDLLTAIHFTLKPQTQPAVRLNKPKKTPIVFGNYKADPNATAKEPPENQSDTLNQLRSLIEKNDLLTFETHLKMYIQKNSATVIHALATAVETDDINELRRALFEVLSKENELLDTLRETLFYQLGVSATPETIKKAHNLVDVAHPLTQAIRVDLLSKAHANNQPFLQAYFGLEAYMQARGTETWKESTHFRNNFSWTSTASWMKPWAKINGTRYNKERKMKSAYVLRRLALGVSSVSLEEFNKDPFYQNPLSEGRINSVYMNLKPFIPTKQTPVPTFAHETSRLSDERKRYNTM